MELTEHRCSRCGAELTQQSDTRWKCRYCGATYDDTTAARQTQTMRELFDETKLEIINNLRRLLYDATTAEYISNTDVKYACVELKKYLPDDFRANFYEIAIGNNLKKLTYAIRNIDVEANLDEIDTLANFLIKSLQPGFLLELNNLVERAYKNRDLQKFEAYATAISVEAEKVQLGVYETKLPREVFVAYSSKDMEKVSELVEFLESQGLKCFVAARNLRHGKGATENYDMALKEAMDHCKSFVFVSSTNSRSFSCDALEIEIPYVQKRDLENAPAEYRNNYASIPHQFKKPRVEYRIEGSRSFNAADEITNSFFSGYEWVLSPSEVAVRVTQQLVETPESISPAPPQAEKKYCASCGTAVPIAQKFCSECGKSEFVNDISEFIRLVNERNGAQKQPAQEKTAEDMRRPAAGETAWRGEEKEKEPRQAEKLQKRTEKLQEAANSPATKAGETLTAVFYILLGLPLFFFSPMVYGDLNWFLIAIGVVLIVTAFISIVKKQLFDSIILALACVFYNIGISLSEWVLDSESILAFWVLAAALILKGIYELIKCKMYKKRYRLFPAIAIILAGILLYFSIVTIADDGGVIFIFKIPAIILVASGAFLAISKKSGIKKATLLACPIVVCMIGATIAITVASPLFIYEKHYYGNSYYVADLKIGTTGHITIPDAYNGLPVEGIASFAFDYGTELTSVTIPDSIEYIGSYAFSGCTNLTSIVIPNSVTEIGSNAFSRCTRLTSVTIPDSVTMLGSDAFSGCKGLTSITIPNSIARLDSNVFSECKGLTSVTIPDSVTEILSYAFSECSRLTSVTIPDSVTVIERYVFEDCTNLQNITFQGTKAQWYAIDKDDWDDNTGSYTIHCTDGDISK